MEKWTCPIRKVGSHLNTNEVDKKFVNTCQCAYSCTWHPAEDDK